MDVWRRPSRLVLSWGGGHNDEPEGAWALVHRRVERVEEFVLFGAVPCMELVDDHRRGVEAVGDEAVCRDGAENPTVEGVADLVAANLEHVGERARLDKATSVLEDNACLIASSCGEDHVRLVRAGDELPER
jgi:hypothetical protein